MPFHSFETTPNILITGTTYDADSFAPSRIIRGVALLSDVFLTELSPDLNAHLRTIIVGGRRADYSYGMAQDSSGNVFIAGTTENPDTLADERHFFGIAGGLDAFVLRIPAGMLSVEEKPSNDVSAGIYLKENRLVISMDRDGYVGWDIYTPDGRLLHRESVGYLLAGRYTFRLNLKKGKYLLLVRAGETLKSVKAVR